MELSLALVRVYHSQTDGQTEVVDKTLEMYLRYFSGSHPKGWSIWLSWAEFCYWRLFLERNTA